MQDFDFLFIVAEVAVTLAGFAGLVTIIAQRLSSGESHAGVEAHQLRAMLIGSLLTAGFALFPYLPIRLGLPTDIAFRLSSFCFLVAWIAALAAAWPTVRSLRASGEYASPPPLFYVNMAVHGSSVVALALASAGVFGPAAGAAYLCALFASLYISGSLFVGLYVSLARG